MIGVYPVGLYPLGVAPRQQEGAAEKFFRKVVLTKVNLEKYDQTKIGKLRLIRGI